jgi:F420-0:gamma-glutamyl ligase-like protein
MLSTKPTSKVLHNILQNYSRKQQEMMSSDPSLKKLNLMRKITKGAVNVDDDSILLINATEVLTKDGIHGIIAPIGVGFGTGRHSHRRKSPSPLAKQRDKERKEKTESKNEEKKPKFTTRKLAQAYLAATAENQIV